jgi:hypothetical protein
MLRYNAYSIGVFHKNFALMFLKMIYPIFGCLLVDVVISTLSGQGMGHNNYLSARH